MVERSQGVARCGVQAIGSATASRVLVGIDGVQKVIENRPSDDTPARL